MGSIFAAGWARGWSAQEMMQRVRDVFAPKRALVDLTLPMVALLVGGKLERVLRSLYEGVQIEDLWTPFFCASTNLSRPGVIVHQRGPLWTAIRASVSLPGIFPPVRAGEDLLVDGGVLDNLPIETTSELCDHGPVIAVDVSDGNLTGVDARYDHKASGWRMLGRKLNPCTDRLRVPSVFDVIMQSAVVASRQTQERAAKRAALFLKPPVDNFATMEFHAYEELRRVGYEYAKERLAEWSLPADPAHRKHPG